MREAGGRAFRYEALNVVWLVLIVVLGVGSLKAIQTLAPGTSIPSEIDQAYTAGFSAASQIRIHYTAVGISPIR